MKGSGLSRGRSLGENRKKQEEGRLLTSLSGRVQHETVPVPRRRRRVMEGKSRKRKGPILAYEMNLLHRRCGTHVKRAECQVKEEDSQARTENYRVRATTPNSANGPFCWSTISRGIFRVRRSTMGAWVGSLQEFVESGITAAQAPLISARVCSSAWEILHNERLIQGEPHGADHLLRKGEIRELCLLSR